MINDYKEYKNGVTYCSIAKNDNKQPECGGYILNKRTNKCTFVKFGMLCDRIKNNYDNVIAFNNRNK